ncbi:MAG TPA: HlyD family efflux transporter periplasmic adaptor subunit [Ramlibacter sp.]|nr:HlyD family efflux transporter periplasmic adaptor subunit [Ramlibacter sp.]
MESTATQVARPIVVAETVGWTWRLRKWRLQGRSESIVPRLAGYALLAFVLWLVISTLIRPLVSRQATRAVLQAPAVLITSPISGVVTQVSVRPLDRIAQGSVVATVQNPTLDRDILTTLTTQRLALQSQVSQLGNQLAAFAEELQFVEQQVKLYRKASMAQTRDAWQVAQRQRDVALTSVAEHELKVRQTSTLLDQGAVSPQMMDAAQAQLRTSRANAAVAEQALNGLGQSVANASQGAFVGAGGGNVFQSLVSRREMLVAGMDRAKQDSDAVQQQLRELGRLEDDERRRIDKLAAYEIRAAQPGQVHTVLMPAGSYVPQGATLVRMTDCSRVEVVAVFAPRLARRLNMGSMLTVTTDDNGAELPARVTQLLPVAPAELQSNYTVPFPFAEEGSVYAVARIEGKAAPDSPAQASLCAPGKVVSTRLDS